MVEPARIGKDHLILLWYLQKHGYKVIQKKCWENILGELCYSSLEESLSKLIWSIYLEEVNIVLLLPRSN